MSASIVSWRRLPSSSSEAERWERTEGATHVRNRAAARMFEAVSMRRQTSRSLRDQSVSPRSNKIQRMVRPVRAGIGFFGKTPPSTILDLESTYVQEVRARTSCTYVLSKSYYASKLA